MASKEGNSRPSEGGFFKSIKLLKEASLGSGGYGTVCKIQCDELLCAGKTLSFLAFSANNEAFAKVFEQETKLLSTLHHPNIVQYLGTWTDPASNLPVLLMELMDHSLTQFLEQAETSLPFHIQVNICHDIALALSFLHSNGIIHRDLSSNNILMIGDARAKVSDFNMAQLWDANQQISQGSLSKHPASDVYMPPDYASESHSERLDCFSFGVICIHVLTQLFPQPGQQFKIVHISDPNFPNGIETRASEAERRKEHIDMIPPDHPLLPIARKCIKDKMDERPTSASICRDVAGVKMTERYTESITLSNTDRLMEDIEKQVLDIQKFAIQIPLDENTSEELEMSTITSSKDSPTPITRQDTLAASPEATTTTNEASAASQEPSTTTQETPATIPAAIQEPPAASLEPSIECPVAIEPPVASPAVRDEIDEQLDAKNEEIQSLQERLREMHEKEKALQSELEEHGNLMEQHKTQLDQQKVELGNLSQQLREKDAQVQKHEQDISHYEKKVQELQQALTESKKEPRMVECSVITEDHLELARVNLEWMREKRAPIALSRTIEAITCTETMAYVVQGGTMYMHNVTTGAWTHFIDIPVIECGLAIVKRKLTLIGGRREGRFTSRMLCLVETAGKKEWLAIFPPMTVQRSSVITIQCQDSLIVAGGEGEGGYLKKTEVFNMESLTWQTVANLPEPLVFASACHTGSQLYVMGGWVEKMTPSYTIYTCSIQSLLQSSPPPTTPSSEDDPPPETTWGQIASLPLKGSTCVAVKGRLLAIGGRDIHKPTSAVNIYNPLSNSWEVLTHLSLPRHQCFAAVLDSKLVVVGGWRLNGKQVLAETSVVETATIS